MKLATFKAPGAESVLSGEVRDGSVIAFADGETVLDRLRSGDRSPATGQSYPLADVELLAPHHPREVFAIGLNYAKHAAEGGRGLPSEPAVFLKRSACVIGPTVAVRKPPGTQKLDYEAELVVVMGPDATIAGWAVADDVSARDWQSGDLQWWRAKASDTFCPFGPWVTTADEIADPYALGIRSYVNGELRQDASTDDLIFKADRLIEFISAAAALEPGDLILTGTPEGVGMAMDPPQFLQAGDRVKIEIDQLGSLEHEIEE